MPKEYVSSEPQERGSISVSWGRDHGSVQLTVAGPIGWRHEAASTAVLDYAGDVARVVDDARIDPDNGLDWNFSPTRSEINKLIRVLRTARDQAFGRDE